MTMTPAISDEQNRATGPVRQDTSEQPPMAQPQHTRKKPNGHAAEVAASDFDLIREANWLGSFFRQAWPFILFILMGIYGAGRLEARVDAVAAHVATQDKTLSDIQADTKENFKAVTAIKSLLDAQKTVSPPPIAASAPPALPPAAPSPQITTKRRVQKAQPKPSKGWSLFR
jgi:hypothetical protein